MRLLSVCLLGLAPVSLAAGCVAQGVGAGSAVAQMPVAPAADARTQEIHELRAELARLAARLDALEKAEAAAAPASALPVAGPSTAVAVPAPAMAPAVASSSTPPPTAPATQPVPALAGVVPATLPGGATLNYTFDGYFEHNFNSPPGRVNDLRAYDVLSDTISINQADVIFELAPDVSAGRRYGLRLDLQFGQATDTLQGNAANEPRPDVYRNIFQAYGTYVVPVGKGLTVDFGKWASSLGIEGNYTKDQNDYTRSYYFYFLPFYHAGVRASYRFNDKLAVNYWLVNGTNQSEPTNGYKDELFGFVYTPVKNVSWTSNYYLGQEHPDTVAASNCSGPVQPGLCLQAIPNAPNGKLHIFDNYVTWQATPKLSVAGEADYVIQREYATAAPGESSAPSHVTGGAGYALYQATPKASFALRGEYLSDRGGLFSNATQALKEGTGTYKRTLGNGPNGGLDAFLEYRRDWTNIAYFTTAVSTSPAKHQDTLTLGLVWWYGGKQGGW